MYKYVADAHADERTDRRFIIEVVKTRKLMVVTPDEFVRFDEDGLIVREDVEIRSV